MTWWIPNGSALKAVFLFILGILVFERLTNTFGKKWSSRKAVKLFHKNFFYVLLVVYLLIILLSILSLLLATQVNLSVSVVGAFILVIGIMLRRSAIQTLSEYWSIFVEVKEGQQLVNKGIYAYLKHPYYTAVVFELIGFSLFCNAYWSVFLTLAIQIPLLLIRISVENRVLRVYGRRLKF